MIQHSSVLCVARPTDNLVDIARMYQKGLGFKRLKAFENRAGEEGIILGLPGQAYHLEFTRYKNEQVGKAPTEDNLLVFYIPDTEEWQQTCVCMEAAGFNCVESHSPHWDTEGRSFEDIDGYRVVLQNTQSNH
ncbi:MAG: VOC family protein [Kordiimonas sp.]